MMKRILLGSVVGNLFYYQLRRITEILVMAGLEHTKAGSGLL